MSQLRDIKNRIDSVTKTRKMTQAMKMVAAAKFKRATQRVQQTQAYLAELEGMLSSCLPQLRGVVDTPYLNGVSADKEAVIIITGDRGLCGGFNTNIIKYAENLLSEKPDSTQLYLFGAKGYQHFRKSSNEIVKVYEKFLDNVNMESVDSFTSVIKTAYLSGEFSKITLVYNEFKNALASNLKNIQLLPLDFETSEETEPVDYFLEPEPVSVVESLISEYIGLVLYKAFLESFASEQGARMAAMESATDNAGEMIRDLTLIYNRKRQAQITTELTEIVAGAEALVN